MEKYLWPDVAAPLVEGSLSMWEWLWLCWSGIMGQQAPYELLHVGQKEMSIMWECKVFLAHLYEFASPNDRSHNSIFN